ncbi:hypothetical protein [Enterobacter phage EC152]|nr:hypothetical protein SPLA5a_PHROGS00141 [Salmonella phage SPLA5a]
MSFQKVVKAPAKRAHIKNYPHKKSEARERRVKWLWDYAKSLLGVILINSGDLKLHFYEQLRATQQELKDLGCYDSRVLWCMIREAQLEHNRYRRW